MVFEAPLPRWLQELRQAGPLNLRPGPRTIRPEDVVPILALGHWGGQLLEALAAFWESRGLSRQEQPFLWLDVVLPGENRERLYAMFDLLPHQKVILSPPWPEVWDVFRQREFRPFFTWLLLPEGQSPFQYPRLAGRAAFYWEIMRGDLSPLFGHLQRLIQENRDFLRIVVAAWEEPVSGFLVDLAAAYQHFYSDRVSRVEIWLLGPVEKPFRRGSLRFTPQAMRRITQRVLWELSRFQRSRGFPFLFTFAPPRSLYRQDHIVRIDRSLFDRLFYFEGEHAPTHIRHGLSVLVGQPQREYQKRLRNYLKDWPETEEQHPVDGVVVSLGAHLHTYARQEAIGVLSLLMVAGLFFGPLGLYPDPGSLLLPLEGKGFAPRAEEKAVSRLKEGLLQILQKNPDAWAYHQVASLLMEHLNTLLAFPQPVQAHPFQDVELTLRELQGTAQLPSLVRDNLARLARQLQDHRRRLRERARLLKAHWQRAWSRLSPDQRNRIQDFYHEFFAPLFYPRTLENTLWFRVRKRVAWAVRPVVAAGRAHWQVGYALFPPERIDWNRWEEHDIRDSLDDVVEYWRTIFYRLPFPELAAGEGPRTFTEFARQVRQNFSSLTPTLNQSSLFKVPQFHHLALVIAPPDLGQEIETFLKNEAHERYPEIVIVPEPALDGYGLVLHKEPYPMHSLDIVQQKDFPRPHEFVYRGEQLSSWLEGFPYAPAFLAARIRVRLENEEAWLLPWTHAWVLLSTPPALHQEEPESPDRELYQELLDFFLEQKLVAQDHSPVYPTPGELLHLTKAMGRLEEFLAWWKGDSVPKEKDTEYVREVLEQWFEENLQTLQERGRFAREAYFPDTRRAKRRFHHLDSEVQQALMWFYIAARMLEHGYLPYL